MGRPEFKLKMALADHFRMPKFFPQASGSMWELTAAQRALLMGPEKKRRGQKLYSQSELEAIVERGNRPKTPADVTTDVVMYGEALNGASG